MLSFLRNIQDQFDASALKVANQEAPVTTFEKFHVITLDYRTPIIAALLYVVIVSIFSRINRAKAAASINSTSAASGKRTSSRGKASLSNDSKNAESRFTPFKCLVIAHNLFLCLYSATAFLSILPVLIRPYFSAPILEAFCDADKKAFGEGVHYWVWNFYVSKYYELIDTAILLAKGKPSSFLQTFHHSGSIIGMWIMTTTHAPAAWIFVLFNSFIHTVMYFYYTLTCFGYRPSWKKILTSMQITQFLVGNPLGLFYAFLPQCLSPEIPPENIIGRILGSQLRSLYVCLFINTFFISSLVILFTDFSRKTYGKKPVEIENKPSDDKKSSKSSKSSSSNAKRAVSKSRTRSPSRKPSEKITKVKSKKAIKEDVIKAAKEDIKAVKEVKESKSVKGNKDSSSKKSTTVNKRKVASKK